MRRMTYLRSLDDQEFLVGMIRMNKSPYDVLGILNTIGQNYEESVREKILAEVDGLVFIQLLFDFLLRFFTNANADGRIYSPKLGNTVWPHKVASIITGQPLMGL